MCKIYNILLLLDRLGLLLLLDSRSAAIRNEGGLLVLTKVVVDMCNKALICLLYYVGDQTSNSSYG